MITKTEHSLLPLIESLLKLSKENEWVEFKHNNADALMIGERISALANSAVLMGQEQAYMIWGIEDETLRVVGTSFKPFEQKHRQQELESWLLQKISPKIDFHFFELDFKGHPIVLLQIEAARDKPVRFDGTEYIRIGSYTKKLRDNPPKERALWRALERIPFEKEIALQKLTGEKVLQLLSVETYFDLTKQPLPKTQASILEKLTDDKLIVRDGAHWNITKLGGILFAKKLADFDSLFNKRVRIIRYRGLNKLETLKEIESDRQPGYALSFEHIIQTIKTLTPSHEEIGEVYRQEKNTYPEKAIRELVANALIHQDFSISGSSPMIEIYDNRMEITNPGSPLVEVERFMDKPPRSRNESLAALMRRMDICEERGSGIDKVISSVELHQLPAPIFEDLGGSTKIALFTHRQFQSLSKEDRLRACYWHCVFRYIMHEQMSNASLRERFGNAVSSPMISRIIKDAQENKLIKVFDSQAGPKAMRYIPYWA